jgi:hypothetical protein
MIHSGFAGRRNSNRGCGRLQKGKAHTYVMRSLIDAVFQKNTRLKLQRKKLMEQVVLATSRATLTTTTSSTSSSSTS